MHAACGYPVKSTWLTAIRKENYVGWPLLSVENMHKYYSETDETPMGHLDQSRANVRSTKPKRVPLPEATNEDLAQLIGKKEQDVYITIVDTWTMKHKIYSDQTGQFPTRLRRRNRYIMVMVEIDSNYTLFEPMKNRTDAVMINAYRALLKRLKRAGVTTTKHVFDNECST